MVSTDTKKVLLDCAQDLIQRVGVNAMSYNDLSVEVGIRKASIHYHFPKKEDLIGALLTRCGNEYAGNYQRIAESDLAVDGKLEAIVDLYEQALEKGKICLVGMLCVESATLSDSLQSTLEGAVNCCVGVIEDIFAEGIRQGRLSGAIGARESAFAFHDFLLGAQIMARCLRSTEHFSVNARSYLSLLLKG